MSISATNARYLDETLLWLCSIASPIGEEGALSRAVEERVRKASFASSIERVGDSIVATLGARENSKTRIALVGHLDTVRTENGPARIENGRCFGAGSSDMKSGLAVMLAVAELADKPFDCEIKLVFYAREEGPYAENELGDVLDKVPSLSEIDLAVCLEPSDNRVHLGCAGSLHARVTFEGRTSHSARPWEGANAVHAAAPFLARIAALKPRDSVIDGQLYRTVTSVTSARDLGRGRNIVPDRFELNVNHRFAPCFSVEDAEKEVTSLVGSDAQIVFTDRSPGAMPNASNRLVRALIDSGVRGVAPKQAWTDVARFAARGVAAVNFGPGENAQAHQKNESTSLELVHEGYEIVKRWITAIS